MKKDSADKIKRKNSPTSKNSQKKKCPTDSDAPEKRLLCVVVLFRVHGGPVEPPEDKDKSALPEDKDKQAQQVPVRCQ